MKRKDNLFSHVPVPKVPRNLFDLSHEVKMSGKFGYLYPCMIAEMLPGDTARKETTCFLRTAPLLSPVMHRMSITVHDFFVPYRLLWDNWETFITGGQDGEQAPFAPVINVGNMGGNIGDANYDLNRKGSLWDYLGFPVLTGAVPGAVVENANFLVFAFRAYAKIFNDFYRDPNFDDELDLDTEFDSDVTNYTAVAGLFNLRVKGWRKDYFTSALAEAQRGPDVLLPLQGTGSVIYQTPNLWATSGGGMPGAGDTKFDGATGNLRTAAGTIVNVQNIDEVVLDASEVTINDFRRALAIQRWMENNSVGGARYTEQMLMHFGVVVPDFRLDRAEYLGGGRQVIRISEVLSTAETDDAPIGEIAGHGISVGNSNRFSYRCQEHGVILSIVSCTPDTAYSGQGVEKMHLRLDKLDFPFPELAHIGEQAIENRELFFRYDAPGEAYNVGTFGYTPRYSDMKFKNDRIAGDFHDTLDFWHLSRFFTSAPVLDSQFTTMHENATAYEDTYRRIFNVTNGTDYLWMQMFHKFTVMRPLPYFGVPKILG